MDLSVLILFFVYLVNIALLVFVLFCKKIERSWPFFWILLLIIIWQSIELFNITYLINKDTSILLFSLRAGLLPTLYIAPAFIKLVFSLFGKWDHRSRLHKFFWYLPAIIMSAFVFTPYNVAEVFISGNRFFYTAGALYWFFALYFLLLVSYGLYVLAKNKQTAGPIIRRQIAYIFVATALASAGALIFNILFPILGMHNLYYLGINSTIFFTVLLTYSLFRYRFFALKIFLYQSFINLLKILITGFVYYIFYILFHDFARVDFNNTHNIIFLILVFGLTAPFIFHRIHKLLLILFISPENDIRVSVDKIAYILRSSRDLDVLLSRLAKEINKIIDYNDIFVYLSKKKDLNVFYQVFPVGERLFNKADSDLIKYLSSKKKTANLAEEDYFFTDKMLIAEMEDMNVDIALPIFYNKQLLGILMIDNDGKLLSIQELNFLKDLNKYLDIAVGSLLLYQQDLSDK
jgi:hypothetical protein